MSCPTCDHTMQRLCAEPDGTAHFHCPRCGTHRMVRGDWVTHSVPMLVNRCRRFGADLDPARTNADALARCWKRLGIADSINLSGDRP